MRNTESRLGIFAFLGAALFVLVGLVIFARYPGVFRTGPEFRTEFRNVAGLNLGDEVRYGGVLVGSIISLSLIPDDPTRIEVRFRVNRRTPILEDTRASITQIGMLGVQYLNLEPGRRESLRLPPGSTLQSDDNLNFQDAMNKLARFFERTDTLFGDIETLARGSPLERLDRMLDRVDAFIASTDRGSERVFSQLDVTTAQLNALLTQTERVVATADSALRDVGPGLSETQREALVALRETRGLIADMRDAMQQEGGLDALISNLHSASDNIARLAVRLERDPTSILKQRDPPRKIAGPPIRD